MQSDKKASEEKTAVSEGFEPPVRCRTPVFEAGSFNHSDNSPVRFGTTKIEISWDIAKRKRMKGRGAFHPHELSKEEY